ncbi:hypothetical protein [Microtetraspora sp. NBRC 16547]|uniref:hypothetical protein n=1 Tax=Microtetraspora sp. NBRC 16547 TaxID=3030993 RepID=UPI0024A30959|nr:hypothetical protein [Microtetraspora sp. NBRC 16547]GLW99635.1 hypothetical protein Misp02_37220 [Microtetraspora sp. NBRC 16547]
MTRYLAGLITATAALGAGVWLMLAPYGLDYPSGGTAVKVDMWTGAGACALSLATIVVWARAWRAQLRADGLLPERPAEQPAASSEQEQPPAPAPAVPTTEDLHSLLKPLVAALAADQLERTGNRHTEEDW